MEWFVVLSLITMGLVLMVIEIIFVPGTTVVGFIGFGLIVFGIVLSFNYFGDSTGWIVFGGTAIASAAVFIWTFRSKPWQYFSLKTSIKSKVNEHLFDDLTAGEEGVTTSALRPVGKANLHGKLVEVTTQGGYVEVGTRIKIIRILSNQILVEPLN